jgi:hypothetical protein
MAQMNKTRVSVLLSMTLVAVCGSHCSAQSKLRSFDPNVTSSCDKAVGKPASDWIGDQRAYGYRCAEYDLRAQDSDFAMLQRTEDKEGTVQGAAFRNMLATFRAFRNAYLESDVKGCGGGNSCGDTTATDEAALTHRLLLMLLHLQSGALPDPSLKLATEDAALNAVYRAGIRAGRANCPPNDLACDTGEVEARKEERAWIRYRDTFVAYAVIRWPAVRPDTWCAYLTHLRTAELQAGDGMQ